MFVSVAVRGASVLYNVGAEGIAEWTSAVDDTGFAAEIAACRLDNLKGDIEQFGGALETAVIKAGEGANGPLRALTQGATELVNQFGEAPSSIQNVTMGIVGGGGLVALGVAGLGKLVIGINSAK